MSYDTPIAAYATLFSESRAARALQRHINFPKVCHITHFLKFPAFPSAKSGIPQNPRNYWSRPRNSELLIIYQWLNAKKSRNKRPPANGKKTLNPSKYWHVMCFISNVLVLFAPYTAAFHF